MASLKNLNSFARLVGSLWAFVKDVIFENLMVAIFHRLHLRVRINVVKLHHKQRHGEREVLSTGF